MAFAAITNSTIRNNPGAGIKVTEMAGARIGINLPEDGGAVGPNTISGNGGDGISVSNKSTAQIALNTISGNAGNGISVSAASSASTASNLINGNKLSGVAASERSYLLLGTQAGVTDPDTTTTSNAQFGIECASGAVVTGNLSRTNGLGGTGSQFGPGANAFDLSCPRPATSLVMTPPPTLSASKLGPHILGAANNAGAVTILDACPRVAKWVAPTAGIDGPNKLDNLPNWYSDPTAAKWVASFWSTLADLMHNAGYNPLVGSLVAGQPSPATTFAPVASAMKSKAYKWGWSYHSYSFGATTSASAEAAYALYYRQIRDQNGLAGVPLALSEGGYLTTSSTGWQGRLTGDQYLSWLKWFDGQMKQDSEVFGLAIFQVGDTTTWQSFDVTPIAQGLANYLTTGL